MPPDFPKTFQTLKRLSYAAAVGAVLLIVLAFRGIASGKLLLVVGILMVLPCVICAYVLTILHWKHRYRGTHSTLWGVLLLLETSGWMKLVYIFRHILPDARQSGRYRDSA